MDLWGAVLSAGVVGLSILGILLVFSVFSWTIILYKFFELRRASQSGKEFVDNFYRIKRFDELYELSNQYPKSPTAQVFRQGYQELAAFLKQSDLQDHFAAESISHVLRKKANQQLVVLERFLPFLATVGSTSPFIGLLGTVIGIIRAFHMIGQKGSANLATVAPGIAEALIATAAGLLAAIPAVMAYNYFSQYLKSISGELSGFNADFLHIANKSLRKRD